MKRFKMPKLGNNVVLRNKKSADFKEVKLVEVEDEYFYACLLYTSDAADDMQRVEIVGSRGCVRTK
ncbi:hypothetical protein BHU41_11165 [Lactobacillus crispatus]|uniref:Uncharacterized protein n=1 Tax=Lactobacillus crispatus TaxID=47770 RepID=A0A2M9WPL7_9LACO|nr:hypothetical protein [Lactobacillus crispatus]PJZ17374.1 hypothetical protein BHU41_11165 [Lactobacillus crispatus]